MVLPRLLIFDDGRGDFGPLTDLRAAFDLRTGAATTLERLERVLKAPAAAVWVPEHLAALTQQAHPEVAVNHLPVGNDWLVVNGRWPGMFGEHMIPTMPAGVAMVETNGDLLAARVDHAQCQQLVNGQWHPPKSVMVSWLPIGPTTLQSDGTWEPNPFYTPAAMAAWKNRPGSQFLERPWHLLDWLQVLLPEDLKATALPALERRAHAQVWGGQRASVRVAPDAAIQPGCVFLVEKGPIVIDAGALVGACSVLEGPCYVGAHSTLAAHTYLRPHSVIGPACKVAGEVSFSILHGYTNKAHFGYLGHSLVGQWVNLGAGTTVSNLKNTYGSVRVQLHPDRPAEDSGTMFHGPIIGDHVRTAIGSRLVTGACLATGTMLALSGFAPKCTKPLGFYTDAHPEGVPTQIDKFLQTVRAMMARRQGTLGPAEEARLRQLAGSVPARGVFGTSAD